MTKMTKNDKKKSTKFNIAHYEWPLRATNLRAFIEPLKVFKTPYLDILLHFLFGLYATSKTLKG